MSLQVSATSGNHRHLADFHSSVWGHHFIHSPCHDTSLMVPSWMNEVNVLKEQVRKMITTCRNKSQLLNLVDAIQRLGIAYHFEQEIGQQLHTIFTNQKTNADADDLHTTSLEFRLLRQHGYFVSTDILNKLKDREGRFSEDLKCDVRGLLSLYEASFLSVHGEDTLDQARAFAKTALESVSAHLNSSLSEQVVRTLKWPLQRNIERQVAVNYMGIYEQDEGHVQSILKLAKLDFNILQRMEQEELMDISMWWKDLDFARKLPFVRDRVVECYLWPFGVFFEPKYGSGRKMLAKAVAMYCAIDDIYDAFGTLQELELYTQVIQSFEVSNKEKLPEYMQVNYQGLLDLYKEFEEHVTNEGRLYCMFYVKELTKELVRAYLIEARWFNKNHIPTIEEYLENGYTTSIHPLLTAIAFLGMGEFATKEVFDWLLTRPKILKASAYIFRLMDDIASHKFEQSRGHVASAVECYMKQHGVSEKEACDGIKNLVENAWKDINEEILKPCDEAILMPLRKCILNFAKVTHVVYLEEDSFTDSKGSMKKVLATLLLKPFSI